MINENKKYTITTSRGIFGRSVVKTHFIQAGEDIFELVSRYVVPHYKPGDTVAISSKIVSLCQNRIVYKKDIKISALARFLSKFASSSEAGVGVDCIWKMQYAIDYCGSITVIWAALCGGFGKLLGKRGIFYDIVGDEIRGLDGFYGKSFPEYCDFGIRIPTRCIELCDEIYEKTGVAAFISDANDFTRDIFGKAGIIEYPDGVLCEMIEDNPAGQSNQCTPFIIIRQEENIKDE